MKFDKILSSHCCAGETGKMGFRYISLTAFKHGFHSELVSYCSHDFDRTCKEHLNNYFFVSQ